MHLSGELVFFFFKQKTAYEMRISDWSSDVCSSDLRTPNVVVGALPPEARRRGMILVSFAFAVIGFTLAAILTHMVPMLGALGLGAMAVVVGSIFGPAQVASRLINMIFGTGLPPTMLAVISGGTGRASCRARVCQDG